MEAANSPGRSTSTSNTRGYGSRKKSLLDVLNQQKVSYV